MPEINVNQSLIDIFKGHHIETLHDNEFVYPQLFSKASSKIKFKAKANYTEINDMISSQLDVMIVAENGEKIYESFGDVGATVEAAISNNLNYFSISSLHPLLSAFGVNDEKILSHVDIEEWEINNHRWIANIGLLIPKTNSSVSAPPQEFFNSILDGIQSQKLENNLHWFRGYYLQYKDEIMAKEFLMDNQNIIKDNPQFSNIPIMPNVDYYSCRVFIVLKRKD